MGSAPIRIDADNKCAAVVFGGYVNGYSIIRELRDSGVGPVILVDSKRSLASFSNKITKFVKVPDSAENLVKALSAISKEFGYLVLFPTADNHLEILASIEDRISSFSFLPFNQNTSQKYLDKVEQYGACERAGVPFPKTIQISRAEDLELFRAMLFPIIVKPRSREDLEKDVFRNLVIDDEDDLVKKRAVLEEVLAGGINLMASEVIPGKDDAIYAYTAYRSKDGALLNEWVGRKLSQHPQYFGVFSSASNEAPPEVSALGRKLVEAMDVVGIVEPEFKFDHRDGQYKLMEVNLRSMMWHRLGSLCGVHLQLSQWRNALGLDVVRNQQERNRKIHLVYMKHEILNLISDRKYFPVFRKNMWGGAERHFAIFNWRDPLPAMYDCLYLMIRVLRKCLKG